VFLALTGHHAETDNDRAEPAERRDTGVYERSAS
jgi:hypothetical protein